VKSHLRNYLVQLFPLRYRSSAAVAIMCWGMKNLKNRIPLHSERETDRCRIRDQVKKKTRCLDLDPGEHPTNETGKE
jgi:hypothetical protein